MKPYTLQQRAQSYNLVFSHLDSPNVPLVVHQRGGRAFLIGFWFVGGANISSFYGSYQIEYLKRMDTLFSDCKGKHEMVHLFSGSIPISTDYTIVGLPDKDYQPEIECDAHQLSSRLPFRPSLILADPPYEEAANGKYAICDINRTRVLEECALVLRPGGFVVWMDQSAPVFSNERLSFVGAITYLRSTGNRYRVVGIYQKPANAK
jgi:hypothetical protein